MAGVANYLNCLPYFFRYYFQNTRKERILFFHHIIINAFRKEFGCTVYDKSCNHPHFPWTSWLPKVTITLFMSLLICPAMQLNQGGEYAFHSLFYMVDMPVSYTHLSFSNLKLNSKVITAVLTIEIRMAMMIFTKNLVVSSPRYNRTAGSPEEPVANRWVWVSPA